MPALCLLSISLLLLSACSATSGTAEAARQQVERFFDALESGETELLARIAPELSLDGPTLEALQGALAGENRNVEIEDIEVEGRSAIATVHLEAGVAADAAESSTPGAQGAVTLLVPLSWDGEGWIVEPSLTVEQRLDFVPID